jgi:hypothetical protein
MCELFPTCAEEFADAPADAQSLVYMMHEEAWGKTGVGADARKRYRRLADGSSAICGDVSSGFLSGDGDGGNEVVEEEGKPVVEEPVAGEGSEDISFTVVAAESRLRATSQRQHNTRDASTTSVVWAGAGVVGVAAIALAVYTFRRRTSTATDTSSSSLPLDITARDISNSL